MKNRILKYYADLMTDEEKLKFESDLQSDENLLHDYEAFINKMNNLKANAQVQADEIYFRNLIPRVRIKYEDKPKKNYMPAISFVFSALLLFVILNWSTNFNNKTVTEYTSFNSEVIDEYFSNPVDEESIYLYTINEQSSRIIPEDLIESGITDYTDIEYYDVPVMDDYEIIEYLSENELTRFYNELGKNNLLGE